MFLQSELIEMFYAVVAVTDNLKDAENTVEMFLKGYEGQERLDILTELGNRDSRFLGWDSLYTFIYPVSSMSGDALYLTRRVSELVRTGDFEIKLCLIRRL